MKPSIKPANDTREERTDYTDRTEYNSDSPKSASLAADTSRCVTWADALVERGVIGEDQRRAAEHALWAMFTAGTTKGPRDDRARDVVRRMLQAAANPSPQVHHTQQRRAALVEVLRARQWTAETRRSLHRVAPAFASVTREIYERAIDPSDHRFAARLSVAVGAWGDRNEAASFDRFERAAREQSRKPRKR